MPLAVNDIIQVKWRSTAVGQEFQFVQNYRVLTTAATGPLTALAAIAGYFNQNVLFGGPSALTTAWLAMLANGVSNYAVDAQRLLPAKTAYVRSEGVFPGTGGTGPRATNTAAVFTLTSAAPGRNQLAKYHIGPIADAYMVSGSLSTAALTALRALANQAILVQTITNAAPGDTTLQPVILHRSVNANPRWVDVAQFRINFFVRTQRRRTIAVGK